MDRRWYRDSLIRRRGAGDFSYEMCLLHPLASVFYNLRLFSDRTGTGDFYRDTSRPSFAYISDLFGSDTF